MSKPLVVVGSINLDLVVTADHIPRPGETIIGSRFQTFYGGKGANQAVAAARIGYPTYMIGNVGDDVFGQQLVAGLAEAGVETSAVKTVPGSSGVALITIGTGGENNIVVVPGANGLLTPRQLEESASVLEHAGFLLAQLEIPLETVEYLAEFAERNNIPLMLDPAPARELPRALLQKVEWITPNESEAQLLLDSAIDATDGTNISDAADRLFACGAKNVLLKLGSHGCLVAEQRGPKQRIPAFPIDAVDSTAAGDAFNAAFAVSLLQGKSPQESARFACAVAAISVSRPGAQRSMPTLEELTEFLAQRE
jgi:ribokinase